MRIFNYLSILFLVFFTSLVALTLEAKAAANQSDPVALLQYVANNMIAGLKANKATLKSKPQIVYNLAYQYVVPYADLDLMSKHVLSPRTWNSSTTVQQAQFKKEFTTTLMRTYASSLTDYQDQTVKFYPPRGASGNSVVVQSEIISSGNSPIHVSYRLIRSSGGWRLYDLSVEGVSMLESFRSQFADILSQGNMGQLLARMAGHNKGHR